MAPDSRDPYRGPTDAERRKRGRRILSLSSAFLVALIVALFLLALIGVLIRS